MGRYKTCGSCHKFNQCLEEGKTNAKPDRACIAHWNGKLRLK